MPVPFHPPERILLGPGPSEVSPRVLEALSRPTVGHLDPAFLGLMDEVQALLRYAFKTATPLTFCVSAPGSAGMETVFVNLLEPGDKVIICRNGVFGGRMQENARRIGAEAVMVEDDWGGPVSPEKAEAAMKKHPDAKALAFVHAETSTGARSDAEALCALAARHGCLSIVDAVTSLGGIPLEVDGWGMDAVYSGSQKCLSCVPGLSPVSFSARAVEVIRSRRKPVQSWFLDLNLVMDYWGGKGSAKDGAKDGTKDGTKAKRRRAYHHTAPVNSLYALHESLLILQEEGLENAWARHARNHRAFAAGIEALDLHLPVEESFRLPQLNAVGFPAAVDDAALRDTLLQDYGLEIGSGLGALAGKVWRIGLMGHGSRRPNVLLCLSALGNTLHRLGHQADTTAALTAAESVYASTD